MALPTKLVNWTYTLNNRITYTSLGQVMRETMFLVKNTLKTAGYTVKGSCNGTTGAMDGVDRWVTAADAGTRATTTTAPVSWIVLTDGNGANVLFAYIATGVSPTGDDIYRIGVSHAGDYVAAATPTHQPTSANEQYLGPGFFISTVPSVIGSTASADRIVHIWTAPLAKGFRVAIYRAAALQSAFGVDEHAAVPYAPSVSVSPGHGFFINGALLDTNVAISSAATNSAGGQFMTCVRTNQGTRLAVCGRSAESMNYAQSISSHFHSGQDFIPELQGEGYQLKRLGIFSVLTASRGKVGNFKDWWIGRYSTGASDGDSYGNREFVQLHAATGIVWPWNGTPTVIGSPIVIS